MSLYEFSCARSGWMLANGGKPDEKDAPVSEEDFDRILAAHDERSEQTTRVLSMEEFLSMNKDKVRPS